MIELTRRLGGVVPYSAIYFPDDRTVDDTLNRLSPWRIARLFFTQKSVADGRFMVARYVASTINLKLTPDLDRMWRAMDDTCRRQIRRAEKLKARTTIAFNQPDNRTAFLNLLGALADRNPNVTTISEKRLAQLGTNADVFVLYLNEIPNCAHLFLRDTQSGRARLLHSANRRLEEPEHARTSADLNRLLHWYEMNFYQEQGFRTYDLGGVSEQSNDGIRRFKASFGGEVEREYVYLCAGLPSLVNTGRRAFENFTMRGRQWQARAE